MCSFYVTLCTLQRNFNRLIKMMLIKKRSTILSVVKYSPDNTHGLVLFAIFLFHLRLCYFHFFIFLFFLISNNIKLRGKTKGSSPDKSNAEVRRNLLDCMRKSKVKKPSRVEQDFCPLLKENANLQGWLRISIWYFNTFWGTQMIQRTCLFGYTWQLLKTVCEPQVS